MKRSTHLLLEDWVRDIADHLGLTVTELVHRSIVAALDNFPDGLLIPDRVLEEVLGHVTVKVPEEVKELSLDRYEKSLFLFWLLEVSLKQFKKSGVSVGRLYELFKQAKRRGGDGSTDRQVQGDSEA